MAQVKVQYGCGCERMVETPGPEDPQGLLARLAGAGVHRTAVHCTEHGIGRLVRLPGWEHSTPEMGVAAAVSAPPAELCDAVQEENGQVTAMCMLVLGHDGEHAFQPASEVEALHPGDLAEDCDFTKGRGRGLQVCTLPAGHAGDHSLVPISEVQTAARAAAGSGAGNKDAAKLAGTGDGHA